MLPKSHSFTAPNDTFGFFVAIYLDVLGQQDEWHEIKSLPESQEEKAQLFKTLKRTVGFLSDFRNWINHALKTLDQSSGVPNIPPEYIEDFKLLQKSDIRMQVFSDSILVSIPLEEADGATVPIVGIYNALHAVSIVLPMAMMQGHSIRGGINVGLGMRMPETGEVYGPVLNSVYHLESKIADYPRVVVGLEVLQYFDYILKKEAKSKRMQYIQALCAACVSMIAKDSDGKMILDYLKKSFALQNADAEDNKILSLIATHIRKEQEKWTTRCDSKLIGRYERLRCYYNSAVPTELKI
jgi:hypothetical protein